MSDLKVSVILHHSSDGKDKNEQFLKVLQTVLDQSNPHFEVLILSDGRDAQLEKQIHEINTESISLHILNSSNAPTPGAQVNQAFKTSRGAFILYMDNRHSEIFLKKSAIDLFLMTMERHPHGGMIYSDYELQENGQIKEIHLLKHHGGRLRDNQDYGQVFFFNKKALETCGWADESLQFNTLYDLRFKLSEKHELIHIANRYHGSAYRIVAQGKEHNVFDYLLASKESQLEAEHVLSAHLKRIRAYLEPGAFYRPRPSKSKDTTLKASVIIPVNNRPEFIGTAIESVQAQTVKDVEVIVVVNGGSNDPTVAAVKQYMPGGDKYDPQKPAVHLIVLDINNLGLCLNLGAKMAHGEYYVQLDSDDRLKPDAVEKILQVYDSDPKIGMVIGSYEVWQKDAAGNYSRMEELPVVTHDEWTEENGRNNLLRINGAGAPRSLPITLIKQIGFSLNEEPYARNYGEDYNMILEVSERHRIGRVWEAIYEVVRHAGGTDHAIDQQTIDRNNEAKDYMRLQAIQRRIKLNS